MSLVTKYTVQSPNVQVSEEAIVSNYTYNFTKVQTNGNDVVAIPVDKKYTFKVERKVPKLG
jgi:hypothetical protein